MTAAPDGVRRQYRQPPVVEALIRLRWAEPRPWSIATPGLLYERLREAYPVEPKTRARMQADLTPGALGEDPGNLAVRVDSQQLVFSDEAEGRLAIVAPGEVSVHALPPYEGWESLRTRTVHAHTAVADILGVGEALSGVGLRYINRVVIPETAFRLEDYFTVSFSLPPAFPPTLVSFFDRAEVTYPDSPVRMAFTWASTESESGTSAFILDFDLNQSFETPVTPESAFAALDEMKVKEGQAFEGLLQPKLRELFDARN